MDKKKLKEMMDKSKKEKSKKKEDEETSEEDEKKADMSVLQNDAVFRNELLIRLDILNLSLKKIVEFIEE